MVQFKNHYSFLPIVLQHWMMLADELKLYFELSLNGGQSRFKKTYKTGTTRHVCLVCESVYAM